MRVIIKSVKEQSLLNRRERIDVAHGPIGVRQKVKRLLVKPGQRKIGRSKAANTGRKTVPDDATQLFHETTGQRLDRFPPVRLLAVHPLDLQPASLHSTLHLQQVAAPVPCSSAVLLQRLYLLKQSLFYRSRIHLPQVIEADLRRRLSAQAF